MREWVAAVLMALFALACVWSCYETNDPEPVAYYGVPWTSLGGDDRVSICFVYGGSGGKQYTHCIPLPSESHPEEL